MLTKSQGRGHQTLKVKVTRLGVKGHGEYFLLCSGAICLGVACGGVQGV